MSAEAAFDGASGQFIDHYDQVRGHVRQEVTRHNLVNHLPGASRLRVLDFQGGDGRDALWLLGTGKWDRAVLLDESQEMIEHAQDRIKQYRASVKSRLTIARGGLEQLDDEQPFDAIFSHAVLMYELDDPQGQIDALAQQLKNRGILSLLTKGYDAARRQVKEDELKVFESTGRYTNRLGLPARAYSLHTLEAMVARAGLETIGGFGVRIFSDDDRRSLREVPSDELTAVLNREKAASRDPAQIDRAQMLHIIAKK